jgi:hypothetical protein
MCQYTTAHTPEFAGIYVNANYYQAYVGQTKFLGSYLKPVHALLFRKSGEGALDCVILSQSEAQALAGALKNNPEPDVWISNTAMTLLAGQSPAGINQDPRYQELIEKVRFFSGEFSLLLKGDIALNWLRQDTDKKMEFFKKELRASRETKLHDIKGLMQALADQQTAFNYITQNPSLDYTIPEWWKGVSQALSPDEIMQKRFVDILKRHSLNNITDAMCEQPADILGTFLERNHFKTSAAIVKSVLDKASQQTVDKVIATLFTMDGVSAEVQQVMHEKTADYHFYFKCIAGIAAVVGGVMLVVGILALNPILVGAGGIVMAAGVGVLLKQSGFFSKPPSGAASDDPPLVAPTPGG